MPLGIPRSLKPGPFLPRVDFWPSIAQTEQAFPVVWLTGWAGFSIFRFAFREAL